MLDIETLHTFDTEYSADSVEWCHVDGKENYFVVGTYQLEEKDENVSSNNTRKGRIYLFHYDHDSDALEKVQQIETEAILDQKWIGTSLLTATSIGNIQKYELDENCHLKKQHEVNLNTDDVSLALSIDIDKDTSRVLASDSKGRISLLDVGAEQSIVRQWSAHDFEAWTCAFDRFNKNIVFSGGDDSKLNVWDLRMNATAIKSSKRDAGVTSLLSYKENFLLVGSYDEKLCVNDVRNLKRTVDEINLQGGIWRIKPSKVNESILLVACMYHNFSIVDCSNELKLVGEYFEHESICYGCDFSSKKNRSQEVFASCSFYDHKLSLCKVKI